MNDEEGPATGIKDRLRAHEPSSVVPHSWRGASQVLLVDSFHDSWMEMVAPHSEVTAIPAGCHRWQLWQVSAPGSAQHGRPMLKENCTATAQELGC